MSEVRPGLAARLLPQHGAHRGQHCGRGHGPRPRPRRVVRSPVRELEDGQWEELLSLTLGLRSPWEGRELGKQLGAVQGAPRNPSP